MYYLYVERTTDFSPKKIGEYIEFEDAQEKALEMKSVDPTIRYKIEETNGSISSYGDLLSTVVEEG